MDTKVIKIDLGDMDESMESALEQAAQLLRDGELVAFPTETVYGLGADALNEEAAAKIYSAKGRPSDNPLIVHISNQNQVAELAEEIPETARILMEQFWPGPLTLIFKKKAVVPSSTTGGLQTVALRMPEHKVARRLIEMSGVFIAAPSANVSGRPSPTCAEHVYEDLQGRIPMILDGGPVGIGIESTIIDVTSDIPTILRPGYITEEMLRKAVGSVETDQAVLEPMKEGIQPKAPGMKYRHYAPKAELTLVEGPMENVIRHINRCIADNTDRGLITGVIACEETRDSYTGGRVLSVGSREDEASIARTLYHILREFDHMKVDVIYGEVLMEQNLGKAIMNRLRKAAGYKVIRL